MGSRPEGGSISQRGDFINYVMVNHAQYSPILITPESYKDWNHFDVYQDLLSFEEDLCAFVDVIIIFLEGAGAVGEFGAFLKDPSTAKKLIIVIHEDHWDTDSFIRLGLVLNLEIRHKNAAFSVPGKLNKEDVHQIIEEVELRLSKQPKTEALDLTNSRHLLLTIADFVELIHVARLTDISNFLEALGVTLSLKRLHQLMFVLERLEVLKLRRAGNESFYTFLHSGEHYVEYGLIEKRLERPRIKSQLFDQTVADRRRKAAYERFRAPDTEVENVA
ncbi:retron St85 family effector protein [Paralcaligenes sp. KSB-10]|nr:retron St85 family effector protein [Paralcaligenes sp. KSB-10]